MVISNYNLGNKKENPLVRIRKNNILLNYFFLITGSLIMEECYIQNPNYGVGELSNLSQRSFQMIRWIY
jgi:hypothetical protein